MKLCTAAQMRRLDEKTIHDVGLPGVVLMENAGRGAAEWTRQVFGDLAGKKVVVAAGRGNNGGDGYVMGRIFHGWGARVRMFLLARKETVTGDARINLDAALRMGLELVEIPDETHLDRLDLDADVIVDALLGTGLKDDIRGLYRAVIERINAAGRFVTAVDIPSGVNADTGRILGAAVRADLTVTFGLPKIGLFLPPGETLAGRVEVVDIGIPPHVLAEADPCRELIDEALVRGMLGPRAKDGHKGSYGHALILAGSTGKTGAAALAALAAARSGAGLVTLAVPASLNPILEAKVTEAMTEPLTEDEPGFVGLAAMDRLMELAQGKTVLALGPGLGTRPGTAALVKRLIESMDLPLVVDADGLNVLAGDPGWFQKAKRGALITPHPGEASRLLGVSTAQVQENRLETAARLARETGAVTVLKGYRSVVAEPDGPQGLCLSGGPHLASGGMGDVLTGILAGLAAQGAPLARAARLGVYAHGLAGDIAAREIGPIGLLASDLLDRLPGLWARLMN
jgi:NAD(P)H-hydrate epimerase